MVVDAGARSWLEKSCATEERKTLVVVAVRYNTSMYLLGLNHKRVNHPLHGREERLIDVQDVRVLKLLLI